MYKADRSFYHHQVLSQNTTVFSRKWLESVGKKTFIKQQHSFCTRHFPFEVNSFTMRTPRLPLEGLLAPLSNQEMWRCVILKYFITLIYWGVGEQQWGERGRERKKGRETGREKEGETEATPYRNWFFPFTFPQGGLGLNSGQQSVQQVLLPTEQPHQPLTLLDCVFWAKRNEDVPMRVTHSSSFPTLPGSLGKWGRSTVPLHSVSLAHNKKSGHSRSIANKYRICKSP